MVIAYHQGIRLLVCPLHNEKKIKKKLEEMKEIKNFEHLLQSVPLFLVGHMHLSGINS